LVKRIPTAKTPSHMWIDSKSTTVWATMQDSNELVAVDLATQVIKWRVKTGPMPADVFATPDDKFVLVGLTGGDGVEVFDVSNGPAKKIKKINTGKGAHAFRAVGDKQHVLVSNRVANTLSKIDYTTFTVVDQYPGPTGPDCMDISADGKTIFLASRWAQKLTVIDVATRKVVRQIKVGKSPHGVWTLDHAPRQ
jgi:YVTN family beta-propeller protein